MTETEPMTEDGASSDVQSQAFWDRHAKLSIILIAASFYVVLFAMCATVAILLWLRR